LNFFLRLGRTYIGLENQKQKAKHILSGVLCELTNQGELGFSTCMVLGQKLSEGDNRTEDELKN